MTTGPFIKSLQPVVHADAQGAQKEVLDIALKQVGFIPNMYASMAIVPGVLSTYLHGYEIFRKQSGLTSAEQEVVFLAISQYNGCDYCTAAHSMLAEKMSGVPAEVLAAIRARSTIPDAKLAAVAAMAVEIVSKHGQPDHAVVKAFMDAGYTETHVLFIVMAASVKVLSNYTNQAFGTPLDEKFSAYKVA
jgi:uncharacterized peroxidase-related enzyme